MGLRADLRSAVSTIMTAVGDLAQDMTYKSVEVTGYNPATDSNTVTVTEKECNGFMYRVKEADLSGTAQATVANKVVKYTTQILLTYADLQPIVPKESDYVVVDDVTYEVTEVRTIPRDSGYILVVRKP